MKPFLFFVFSFQLLFVEAADGNGISTIGAVLGAIFAIIFIIVTLVLLCYCYKKYRQKEQERHPVHYINNSNGRTQVVLNGNERVPPPSYFQSEPQHLPNNHTQVTIDQPPSYSAHMNLYHTRASGQPLVSGNLMRGLDNPAFLNRSISSISDLPNMADVLLTSSRTSIPAIAAEGNTKKFNKLSDSARGDSIESKATSGSSQFAYVNPQFSMLFEGDARNKPEDILNERLESDTDSESDLPTDMGGRWLDSIKNQRPTAEGNAGRKTKVERADKLHNGTISKAKSTANKPPSLDKSTQRPHKKRGQKKKLESWSDSGAEVSSNPRGSGDRGQGSNETRLSKISSDSGLGDASTVKKSKQNPRLKWDAVDSRSKNLNRSLSTDV